MKRLLLMSPAVTTKPFSIECFLSVQAELAAYCCGFGMG